MPHYDQVIGRFSRAPTQRLDAERLEDERWVAEDERARVEGKAPADGEPSTPTPRERAEACVRHALASLETGPYGLHAGNRGACRALREALEVLEAPEVVDGAARLEEILRRVGQGVEDALEVLETPVRSVQEYDSVFSTGPGQQEARRQAVRRVMSRLARVGVSVCLRNEDLDAIIAAARTGVG